jgi:hypothetical protein
MCNEKKLIIFVIFGGGGGQFIRLPHKAEKLIFVVIVSSKWMCSVAGSLSDSVSMLLSIMARSVKEYCCKVLNTAISVRVA